MRWRMSVLAVVLFLPMAAGCGDDDPAGPDAEEITGAWQATKVEYTTPGGNPVVDLIALGGSASLLLDPDGSLAYTVTPAGAVPTVTEGVWELEGDIMTVTPDGMPFSWQFEVEYAGDELALRGADVEFDLDGDDEDDPAKLNLEFIRD